MRKPWLLLVALFTVAVFTVQAQIGIPYTFSAGTVIDPDQMNTNFSAVGNAALNRTGGTITGTLNSMGGSLTGTWTGSPTFSGNPVFSGMPTITGTLILDGDGLGLRDTNGTHYLLLTPGSDLTANRVLTFTTGDANRTITLIGNPTLNDWFDQSVKIGSSPSFALDGATVTTGTITDARLPLTMADKLLIRPELRNYKETISGPTITAGVLPLDLSTGNHFVTTLDANITSITFTNVPAAPAAVAATVTFIGDGTARTVTWPASVRFPSALPPTMTSGLGKADVVTFYTGNGGAVWYGMVNGQNF